MAKHFNLQKSESVIISAASRIYAAYISAGRAVEGEESAWMQRSIREAMMIARATDDAVISDDEVDSNEAEGLGGIAIGRTGAARSRHE